MLDELLPYYERELGFLRDLSGEFASRYPKIARRLLLEGEQSEDPHVERLLEGFAFLAARIHRKLDDEFPEITQAFMDVLFPQYLRPSPSASILQLELDPTRPEVQGAYIVPRHCQVLSGEVQGVRCRFQTSLETSLWPVSVQSAKVEFGSNSEALRWAGAPAAITVELRTHGQIPWGSLKLDRLRFFLDGDAPITALLYELLCHRLKGIRVSDGRGDPHTTVMLPASVLRPVGFEASEALLGGDSRVFDGFRLLHEYFLYPDKFMFVELGGLDAAPLQHGRDGLVVQFLLERFGEGEVHSRMVDRLGPDNLRLGCVPIVNLFPHAAEPIRITHQEERYPILPDTRRPQAFEVYSVDRVARVEKREGPEEIREVPEFYSAGRREAGDQRFFWVSHRQQSTRANDKGTDMFLSLVDLAFEPVAPEQEVLSIDLTCTNRDLPEFLPFGGNASQQGDFLVPQLASVKRASLLRKPSRSHRSPLRKGLQWRLISHLTLNHLSLLARDMKALKEALNLYNFTDSQALRRQVNGVQSLTTKVITARLKDGSGLPVFVRGLEATVTLDETAFVGANLLLFAGILNRFLASFAPPNGFLAFKMKTLQHPDEVEAWPPQAGDRPWI
jgi:type VI secretion system protein ImpG